MTEQQDLERHRGGIFPKHWTKSWSGGIGRFVTHETYELSDGRRYHWYSRRHRKGRGGLIAAHGEEASVGGRRAMRLWGWEPTNFSGWIAMIFTVGSALLFIGGLAPFVPNRILHAVTFSFLGSTCFTVAN